MPLTPEARIEFVMVSPAADTVMLRAADLVCAGLLLSVTETVKLEVPEAVGVPEMTPVEGASVTPAGRLPAVTDQV